MAVLNDDALRETESRVVRWKQNGKAPHGYPIAEVTDFCDTVAFLKSEKKKWQRLAERRGQAIAEIFSTASRAIDRLD